MISLEESTDWYFELGPESRKPLCTSRDLQERLIGETQVLQAFTLLATPNKMDTILSITNEAILEKRFDFASTVINKLILSNNEKTSLELVKFMEKARHFWFVGEDLSWKVTG